MNSQYISLLSVNGSSNYVSLLSSSKGGGETAGTVASSSTGYQGSSLGAETAGSVACSSGGGFSSSCGAFSAIA